MIPLALFNMLTSRIGLLIIAAFAVFTFYEGIPIGPLRWVPYLGPVMEELTDGRVDRVARQAREGYVTEQRALAAEAKTAEVERMLEAGRKATAAYAELLKNAQREQAVVDASTETRIAEYEKQLSTAGRACVLDQSDLDFLR